MATEKQIEANRRNALLSTGPRTEEGKARASRNAVKHGLSAVGVAPVQDEIRLAEERTAEWYSSLKPFTVFECWLAEQVAFQSVRIERCQRQEQSLRARLALRAELCWDADRRLEAETLGARLAEDPAGVSQRLQLTPQGCDWLIARWEMLGGILDERGEWTEAQAALALDLLGVAPDLRQGRTRLDPGPGGDVREARRAVVLEEVARLRALQAEVLDRLDAAERAAAVSGESQVSHPELVLLRRYETMHARHQRWLLAQFKGGGRGPDLHGTRPTPPPAPRPDPTPPAPPPTPERGTRPPGVAPPLFEPLPTAPAPVPMAVLPLPARSSAPLNRRQRRARWRAARRA